MNRCPRGTVGLSPVARGHYRRTVGFAEWAERRVTDRVVGRYLGAYNGYIARVLYSNASSPPLTLEELYDVHRRAHVLTVRDLRGGTGVVQGPLVEPARRVAEAHAAQRDPADPQPRAAQTRVLHG